MTLFDQEIQGLNADTIKINWIVQIGFTSEDILNLLEKAVITCKKLQFVRINGLTIEKYSDRSATLIADLIAKNLGLTYLDLSKNNFPHLGFRNIVNKLFICDKLDTLSLNENSIEIEKILILSGFLLKQTSLRNLLLGGNLIDATSLAQLLPNLHKNNRGISSLSLSGNPLGSPGVTLLANWLRKTPQSLPPSELNSLFLSNVQCTDDGIIALSQSLTFNKEGAPSAQLQLKTLNLDENRFQEPGLSALLKAIEHYSPLNQLRLANNPFDDKCFRILKDFYLSSSARKTIRNRAQDLDIITQYYRKKIEEAYTSHRYNRAFLYVQECEQLIDDKSFLKTWQEKIALAIHLQQLDCEEELLRSQLRHLAEKRLRLENKESTLHIDTFLPSTGVIQALNEIIETENSFFDTLMTILNTASAIPSHSKLKPILFRPLKLIGSFTNLFGKLGYVDNDNKHNLMKNLHEIIFSEAFIQHYAQLIAYSEVHLDMLQAIKALEAELKSDPKENMSLYIANILYISQGLMAAPFQRIPRYELLFQSAIDEYKKLVSKPDDSLRFLEESLAQIRKYALIAKNIKNESPSDRQNPDYIMKKLLPNVLHTNLSHLSSRASVLLDTELPDLLEDLKSNCEERVQPDAKANNQNDNNNSPSQLSPSAYGGQPSFWNTFINQSPHTSPHNENEGLQNQ